MVRWIWCLALLAALAAAPAAWAGDGWPVVAVVTAMQAEGDQVRGELRIERVQAAESGLKVGEVVKARWQPAQQPRDPRRPGLYLGDQVTAAIWPSDREVGSWVVVGDIGFLARGEFINPAPTAAVDVGAKDAKVLVKLLAPLHTECHQRTAVLLQELARREPARVRVQILDLSQPAYRQELRREGLTCATVLINNRYEFTLRTPNGKRAVQLWHRPNWEGASYSSEDAVAVAEQEIKRLYGDNPESRPA